MLKYLFHYRGNMVEKEAQNCWEFWNCDMEVRKKCPAFQNDMGKECWMVAGSFNKEPYCPKVKSKLKGCWECPWYKKLNPSE
jgi:hypothetical protein